jgi:hypothetical protein
LRCGRLAQNRLRHVTRQNLRSHKDQRGCGEKEEHAQRKTLGNQFYDGMHP